MQSFQFGDPSTQLDPQSPEVPRRQLRTLTGPDSKCLASERNISIFPKGLLSCSGDQGCSDTPLLVPQDPLAFRQKQAFQMPGQVRMKNQSIGEKRPSVVFQRQLEAVQKRPRCSSSVVEGVAQSVECVLVKVQQPFKASPVIEPSEPLLSIHHFEQSKVAFDGSGAERSHVKSVRKQVAPAGGEDLLGDPDRCINGGTQSLMNPGLTAIKGLADKIECLYAEGRFLHSLQYQLGAAIVAVTTVNPTDGKFRT